MNIVFLSPHFPPNYRHFCEQLNYLGVRVLGLADEPYDRLQPPLKSALDEYYLVGNMHNYDELVRACGYFTHRFGKLDRLDSLNEYWLETEARLRTDFNIFGLKSDTIIKVKRKSLMKEAFLQSGVPAARGKVVHRLAEAKKLVDEVGYPLVAKPDVGVGAAKTYKIQNLEQLKDFIDTKPDVDYLLEEFIQGDILTFDGLTDRDGKLVFSNSLAYSQGIMETVVNDDLIYYYTLREIPADLEDAGRRVLKTYDLRERFFHFEFFRTPEGRILGLEVNMRPPGGLTVDMFNYANDIDIYAGWAHLMAYNHFPAKVERPYHCCYAGRKFNRQYAYTHDQILEAFGDKVSHHERISGVFSQALGDYGYLLRSPELAEVIAMAEYIQAPAEA
jgi:hypothetical protein